MGFLIIEEEVGLKRSQDSRLRHAAHEECLVHLDSPGLKRVQDPKMSREVSGGHEGGAKRRLLELGIFLENSKRPKKLGERTVGQRPACVLDLMFEEFLQPILIVNLLCLTAEQHIVAVESDPQLFAGVYLSRLAHWQAQGAWAPVPAS